MMSNKLALVAPSAMKLALVALTAMLLLPAAYGAPAQAAVSNRLPAIGSEENRLVRERERVRRQQVRQNRHNILFEPVFSPLYHGYNSPGQQLKRSFR